MLPRRFALVRHVDYSGAAGTGVIAYGVAFDDGQVVLRWSSAHRATSVLDSVEDLIAAHGHGETTSIEWIDAPAGEVDTRAKQSGGRRARRPSPQDEAAPMTEAPQMPKPPEAAPAEPAEVAAHARQARAPADSTETRPAHAPQAPVPAEARPAAQTPQTPAQSPADSGHTTAPVPTAQSASAKSAASAQPPAPRVEPPTPPNAAPNPGLPVPPAPPAPTGHEPVQEPPATLTAAAHAPTPPTSNGAAHSPNAGERADVAASRAAAPSPTDQAAVLPESTSPADRNGDQRSHAPGADAIENTAAGRDTGDERRRHEAIATQPMNAASSDDRGQRGPRRAAAPMHESPRSIFEEAEEPPRPDLRLASSNGRSHVPDDSTDSDDTSPGREDFGGFFPAGHQHLDTVTGLLDLPENLNKRGRGPGAAQQDAIASRRNGRHRGE